MNKARWQKLIGKRCLIKNANSLFGDATEVTVLEVSPKGRVKMRFGSGVECWEKSDEYTLVEILPELKGEAVLI